MDAIRVPGKEPSLPCSQFHAGYWCTRREGHLGRHAFIWWDFGGIVWTVWGEKYRREVPC